MRSRPRSRRAVTTTAVAAASAAMCPMAAPAADAPAARLTIAVRPDRGADPFRVVADARRIILQRARARGARDVTVTPGERLRLVVAVPGVSRARPAGRLMASPRVAVFDAGGGRAERGRLAAIRARAVREGATVLRDAGDAGAGWLVRGAPVVSGRHVVSARYRAGSGRLTIALSDAGHERMRAARPGRVLVAHGATALGMVGPAGVAAEARSGSLTVAPRPSAPFGSALRAAADALAGGGLDADLVVERREVTGAAEAPRRVSLAAAGPRGVWRLVARSDHASVVTPAAGVEGLGVPGETPIDIGECPLVPDSPRLRTCVWAGYRIPGPGGGRALVAGRVTPAARGVVLRFGDEGPPVRAVTGGGWFVVFTDARRPVRAVEALGAGGQVVGRDALTP